MPSPIKQRELVRRLRALGWEGPYQKGPHPYMRRDGRRLTIPNPHREEISGALVRRILAQGGIAEAEWGSAGK